MTISESLSRAAAQGAIGGTVKDSTGAVPFLAVAVVVALVASGAADATDG